MKQKNPHLMHTNTLLYRWYIFRSHPLCGSHNASYRDKICKWSKVNYMLVRKEKLQNSNIQHF